MSTDVLSPVDIPLTSDLQTRQCETGSPTWRLRTTWSDLPSAPTPSPPSSEISRASSGVRSRRSSLSRRAGSRRLSLRVLEEDPMPSGTSDFHSLFLSSH